MWLFLLEGTMIGLPGAVVGCLLGVGATGAYEPGRGFNLGYATNMGDIMALMGDRLLPATVSGVLLCAAWLWW